MKISIQVGAGKPVSGFRWMLPPLVALALLVAAVWFWSSHRFYPSPGANAVFHLAKDGWQRLPDPPEPPETLQISKGGAVWITIGASSVGFLEDGSWRIFDLAELGIASDGLAAGFALDGEEVWVATSSGVRHWNGHRWQSYFEGPSAGASIVASGGRAWVIDRTGKLSYFENGRWRTEQIELPGFDWKKTAETVSPDLARTAGGALWLVFGGVWKRQGEAWAAVTADGHALADAGFLGVTGDLLWFRDGHDLLSLAADGTSTAYPPTLTGLSNRAYVSNVASAGGRTWFATGSGIIEWESGIWRHRAPPPQGAQAIEAVAPGPDGEPWALGYIPNPAYRRSVLLQTAVPVLLMIGMLGVPVWLIRRFKQHSLHQHQRVSQAVEHATGGLPEELQFTGQTLARESSWWGGASVVGVIVGALFAFSVIRLVWPAAPAWTYLALALAFHLAGTVYRSVTKRAPKPSDPIGPDGLSLYEWRRTWKALPGSLAVFLLLNMHALPKFVQDNLISWLILIMYGKFMYRLLSTHFMIVRMKRGDYDGALRVISLSHFYNPGGATALRWRGFMQLMAGGYQEAEVSLRRAIAGLSAGTEQAHALESLGDVQMEQGRYPEATRSYEAALHAVPGNSRPYRGMAELLLRQRKTPERALEYVENLARPISTSWKLRTVQGKSIDDYWALKSWALAELGRTAEVAPAIAKAIAATNRRSRSDMAATWRRAGLAMEAIGNRAEADEYFKRAREIDPKGRWGTLAKPARERSVWGS